MKTVDRKKSEVRENSRAVIAWECVSANKKQMKLRIR